MLSFTRFFFNMRNHSDGIYLRQLFSFRTIYQTVPVSMKSTLRHISIYNIILIFKRSNPNYPTFCSYFYFGQVMSSLTVHGVKTVKPCDVFSMMHDFFIVSCFWLLTSFQKLRVSLLLYVNVLRCKYDDTFLLLVLWTTLFLKVVMLFVRHYSVQHNCFTSPPPL